MQSAVSFYEPHWDLITPSQSLVENCNDMHLSVVLQEHHLQHHATARSPWSCFSNPFFIAFLLMELDASLWTFSRRKKAPVENPVPWSQCTILKEDHKVGGKPSHDWGCFCLVFFTSSPGHLLPILLHGAFGFFKLQSAQGLETCIKQFQKNIFQTRCVSNCLFILKTQRCKKFFPQFRW